MSLTRERFSQTRQIGRSSLVRLSPIVSVSVLFAVSRLWSSGLLAGVFFACTDLGLTPFSPESTNGSFLDFLTLWDGTHYREIASVGYPTTLPTTDEGRVDDNSWAFLPVFGVLAGLVATVTGLNYSAAAAMLSCLAGGAASYALYRLVEPRIGHRPALRTVAFFTFSPLGFLLQAGYAEGLFAFLTFSTLIALSQQRYWIMLPFALVAAFTRPGALALALALGIHVVLRLRSGHKFPRNELRAAVTVGVLIAAAGLSWPVIAWVVTGVPDAYLQTEMAWWSKYIGYVDFLPLTPWFLFFHSKLGAVGFAVPVVLAALFVLWISRRSLRPLGSDLLAYGASYGLYLFAVFLPQQSLIRLLLLPMAPLFGDLALTRGRWRPRVVLAVCLVAQPIAVVALWYSYFP